MDCTLEHQSILETIRSMLGPGEDYTYFDSNILIYINAAFSRLCQLGVGPETPFRITGTEETWGDFINDGSLEEVKQYIYLKVKQTFDPPSNSFLLDSINEQIKTLEWLMNSVAEIGY